MKDEDMLYVKGGTGKITINGAFLSALSKLLSTIMDVGRTVGSAIRRARNGYLC